MQKNRTQNYDYTKHVSDSQNFLTKGQLIRKILNLSSITSSDTVLEIGTGKGHLTEALCQRSGFVYSVEIDQKLFEASKAKLSYFITTQIIDKLTNAPNPPTDIWLIMEKGAARRFSGHPRENTKSLLLKVRWEPKIVYRFHREDFHPKPSVDSVLLHLRRKAGFYSA